MANFIDKLAKIEKEKRTKILNEEEAIQYMINTYNSVILESAINFNEYGLFFDTIQKPNFKKENSQWLVKFDEDWIVFGDSKDFSKKELDSYEVIVVAIQEIEDNEDEVSYFCSGVNFEKEDLEQEEDLNSLLESYILFEKLCMTAFALDLNTAEKIDAFVQLSYNNFVDEFSEYIKEVFPNATVSFKPIDK
jgi:hypothetical protein